MIRSLRMLSRVVIVGAIAGGIVYLCAFGLRFDPEAALWSVAIGSIYVAIMTGAQFATGRIADRYLPLGSRRMIVARVLLHLLAMGFSFLAAAVVTANLLGVDLMAMRGMMSIIAMVAIPGTILANTIFYLERFHREARIAEQAAVRAELQALRAKVDPHFLFNSLNSIAALIRIDPEKAEIVTESLADLFRYSLRASSTTSVTLADEMESVELYLTIERARFGERMGVRLDIPDELLGASLPGLLIQPLVENGVKHGVGRTSGRCQILVAARLEEGDICLRVEDSGPGFDTVDQKIVMGRGTGLANVADRLRHQFGPEGTIVITRHAVELRFPFQPSLSNHLESHHDSLHHR